MARASDVASEDFETWTDEGLTEESRIRMFQEKAKSILRATNEKVAAAYRSTFAKRLGEYRKLAAGMAITGERGPPRGGPKPREEGGGPKPREGEVKPSRVGVVSGMAVANEAIPGMTIEQTPDGLWNLQLGDEVIGTYESGNSANRRGRSLTQAQYDRRISQIAKEREVVEEPAVTTTKVETKAEKAAEKQKDVDKRAEEAAAKQAEDLRKKEEADAAKAETARKKKEKELI